MNELIWKNNPKRSRITVDSSPAHQFGSEPIAKVTSNKEQYGEED